MVTIGTPKSATATKVLLCGSGELGKEFVIELQRYGVEVIALDKYADAPAMQAAHRSYVVSMLDGDALREIVEKEKPDYIVPEVEAIATQTLMELEKEGFHVIPTARATWLTMNREGIRRLAAEELGLPTSPYRFAETEEEFIEAVKVIGMPCVVKPIMSSSGHGQSIIRKEEDIDRSWHYAQEGGRAGAGKVIVEGFVDFDYEITQLTVRHIGGTSFLEPVGHVQVDGDYRESWQPQAMNPVAKQKSREIAGKITEALGGRGIFGVELLYMRQEGRGIGLINKLKAYHLQDGGMDTVEANLALGFKADLREYGTGAEILADLGVKKMILMTNNPLKIKGLDGFGLEVVGREPIEMTCNEKNEFYMYTKYKKMGHILHVRNDWKKEE